MRSNKRLVQIVVLVVLLATVALLLTKQQAVADWLRLYGYTPTPLTSRLAAESTFTEEAEHLYLINRPVVTEKSTFKTKCTENEQTIVLGCYHSDQAGIYLLRITDDARLDGVMQVTASHEMLHAAYDRLSAKERTRINALLQSYYDTGLTDERVKHTIELYKQSEPNDLVNEMHSIFGTEIATLPSQLEAYYARYFKDRKIVVSYADAYQGEFIKREEAVARYDVQLKTLKASIEANEATVHTKAATLQAESAELDKLRDSGQAARYNNKAVQYNRQVEAYNSLVRTTRQQIDRYNRLVEERNSIALEQQQLASELSGNNLSTVSE